MEDIKTIHLQDFLVGIKSANVRTKIAAILSETFRRACALEIIDKNVYFGVDFQHYENPKLGALTHDQQEKFLESVKGSAFEDLTKLLLFTGLRQGEALALTADDIDLIDQHIIVNKTLGTDGKPTSPKTKAANRIVPIAFPLTQIIENRMKINSERLFNFRIDITSSFYSKTFKNLNMNFSGHILRHTFITNAYELGFPPYLVQRWVGHAKVQQADVYLALRKAKDFKETEVVRYMRELKRAHVIKQYP